MPDARVALVERHGLRRHTIEIIIGSVVSADVLQTKAEIFAFRVPSFRGAERAGFVATGLVAAQLRAAYLLPVFGGDPDSIEERGIEIHRGIMKVFIVAASSAIRQKCRRGHEQFREVE